MKQKRVKREQGFTLLEVLLAVIILGISVTVILQQFSVALRASTTSQKITLATIHAKQKMEELKLKLAEELSESSDSGSFDDGYDWETRIIPYQHVTEDEEDEQSYENLKVETFQLEATVTWKEGERDKKVALTTLKTVRKKEWK